MMMMKCDISGNATNIQHKLKIDTCYDSIFDIHFERLQEDIIISEPILIKTILFWQSLPEFNPDINVDSLLDSIKLSRIGKTIRDYNSNILHEEEA